MSVFSPFRGIVYGTMKSTYIVTQVLVSAYLGGSLPYFCFFFFLGMLGTYYTRCGLLCEGLSSRNVDGYYVLCDSLLDYRASHDTNLKFSFVVPWVSMFCYFGILNDGVGPPTKGFEYIGFM